MTDRIEQPLPDSLMKTVRMVLADGGGRGGMSRSERFQAVVLLAHGYGLWAGADTVDPRRFAIPEPQWTEISQGLMDMGGRDLESVDMALDWMNVGPGAYVLRDAEVREG